MNAHVRTGLLAGLISGMIWMIISTAVDLGKSAVIVGGLACIVGTWLITMAIANGRSRSHGTA